MFLIFFSCSSSWRKMNGRNVTWLV